MLDRRPNLKKAFARTPILPREAAAIVLLRRRFGYSMNVISRVFHRSSSCIHRILKFNAGIGALRLVDLRKLPTSIKRLSSPRQYRVLVSWLPAWAAWILDSEGKPP